MVFWVDYLVKDCEEISPLTFYREIFDEGALDIKDSFTPGRFTGIACEFPPYTKPTGQPLVRRYSITDELSTIKELLDSPYFVIISPISYVGKARSTANARVMFAFAIEIDNLKIDKTNGVPIGYNDLFHHFHIELLPTPTYIVASGHGLHLYYKFEVPLMLFENVKKSLINFKKSITPIFWNRYVTYDYEEGRIQYESPFQGFRLAGGVTKEGERTRVFRYGKPVSIEYLNQFVEKENEIVVAYKSELSLAEARQKYPEWYKKRIVEKRPRGSWTCKRALYDWWRERIWQATVGHRFNCLFTLAIYAIKCGISEEELESNMYEYLSLYDEKSINDRNRFTVKDIVDALQAFSDRGLVTYPISSIVKRSGLNIERNRRNYRKQKVHLEGARAIQAINDKFRGTTWREGNGRKPKKEIVLDWREKHPQGKKADCIRDTGLSKKTVYKWWR